MDEWKKNIKAVLKDAMTNPAINCDLEGYLNNRVELIVSFVPEASRPKEVTKAKPSKEE